MGVVRLRTKTIHLLSVLALGIFALLLYSPSHAQEILGNDVKLREYLLPVTGFADSGTPIVLDGETQLDAMYVTGSDISIPNGLIPCPTDYPCGRENGAHPYFSRDDYAKYTVLIPQTGKYRLELSVGGNNPATDHPLALLTDTQIDYLLPILENQVPAWDKRELFNGAWGITEKREAIRNHIFGIYTKADDGSWERRDLVRVPTREFDNPQKGSAFIDLTAGEHELLIRLENDIYIPDIGAGVDFGLITPSSELGRNAELFELQFIPTQRTDDVLGVRVYSNKENLDPKTWYLENVVNANPAVSDITVDGYQGIRDNRTVYVNAANVTESGFFTNIYVIAYNINAAQSTEQIFDLMINNWKFNKNILDLAGQDTFEQEKIKNQIRRDTVRLSHISAMQRAIERYFRLNGSYPSLESGTFVPGHSLSSWPSWNSTLGPQLGVTLPKDPLNKMVKVKLPGDDIVAYDCSIKGCTDSRFTSREACEAPRGFWDPGQAVAGEWDTDNQTCSLAFYNGNEEGCLTPRGGCSDPQFETESACSASYGTWSEDLNVLENADRCGIICSLDDNGLPQTGCPSGNQCLGDYCSQVPPGFDPETGWDEDSLTFFDTTTHSNTCSPAIAGALKLGATDCEFNGPYLYQYTALDGGNAYLLNYRLEYQSSLGGCAANECFFDLNGNEAVDSGECIASGQCVPGLRNTVCQIGTLRNSCGDGFVQPECGEVCDPSITDPTNSYCDNNFGEQDWYNEENISGGCSNTCDLVGFSGFTAPPSYTTDPLALSCGGYCGDQVTQFEYGESCDVGLSPSAIRLPNEGGSGGVSSESQYFCTGATGETTGFVFTTNPSFEADFIWTGSTGQSGGWDGKLWTGGSFGTDFATPEMSRQDLAVSEQWVLSQYKHTFHTWTCVTEPESCSLSEYVDQDSCIKNGGEWTVGRETNGKACNVNDACGTPGSDKATCPDQGAQDYCATNGWGSCQWFDTVAGYQDTSVLDKHWISYDSLIAQSTSIQESYYKEANDPIDLSTNPLVIERTSDDARTGSYSIRLTDTGPKSTSLWKVIDNITPGSQYILSTYVKADPAHDWNLETERDSKQVFTHIIFFDDAFNALSVATNTDSNGQDGLKMSDLSATNWQEIQVSQTAPVGATKAIILVRTGYLERGAAFFVDDTRLNVIGNCQTTQGWCGDGEIQSEFGEVCDPGSYTPPQASETRNIIKNPSFEQVFSPWNKSDSVGIRIVSLESYNGTYSLEYEFSDDFTNRSSISQQINLFKDKNYTASVKVKDSIGTFNNVYVQYRELGNSSNWQEVLLTQGSLNIDGWKDYAAAFTPSFDVGEVRIVFDMTESAAEGRALVFVDDIQILPDDSDLSKFLPPQYQCGTANDGKICQYKGGYCGDGVVDFGFGEACDDRVGYACESDAQCGATGQCSEDGVCESDQCDLLCRGTFCGDGVVSQPNSQGINEICDPLNDSSCFFDCRSIGMGGSCSGDPSVCAETLTCAVREFGDTNPVCLGTRGSNGCRSNSDCILGYYCDGTTTQCKSEIPTYLQYHGEKGTQVTLPLLPPTPEISFDITTGVCPAFTTINARGGVVYKLDACTNIYWNGSDNITKPGWTWQDARQNGCFGVQRLPTVDELYSLVKQTASEPYVDKEELNLCCTSCAYDDTDPDFCVDTPTDTNYLYWTGTCVEGASPSDCTRALAVNFKYGSVEAYPTDTLLKTHCLKETVCGNGIIEEGETCEFFTELVETTVTCSQSSDCTPGQVCSENGFCANRKLFEQPITTQCSAFGYDDGALHCDINSCTFREDNCVYASSVNRTCDEICQDRAQICESVGVNIDKDFATTTAPQQFANADDKVRFGVDKNGLCTRDAGTSCDFRFVDQQNNCIVNEVTGEVTPFTSEYSYCNCTSN